MKKKAFAATVAVASTLLAPLAAEAQSMQQLLKRKYDIQQQQAEAAQAAAEAERERAAAPQQTTAPAQSSGTYSNLPQNDPLEGTDATECKLSGGGGIRVSGGFRPNEKSAKCE